jgi:AcrR family transcriptional regulator
MAPQARSETTRQKLLDAAIDLFTQVGYATAGLEEIIERTGMTKGALYHHFDSKEALATAIIEQGGDLTRAAFRQVCESSSPALENLIHGAFIVTDLLVCDKKPARPNNSPADWPNSTAQPPRSGAADWTRSRPRPDAQAPRATFAKASIPTWLANQPLTSCSAPNCTPGRQAATITSND